MNYIPYENILKIRDKPEEANSFTLGLIRYLKNKSQTP